MKRLLNAAAALLCVFGLASVSHSQLTTLTAHSIKMGGVTIASGTVTFTPVSSSGNPIPFTQGGGGLNSPGAFPCTITAGAITGVCQIPDSKLTTPANINYSVQISSSNQRAFVLPQVANITGSSWALDTYAPPAQTSNYQQIQVSYGTAAPPSICVSPSFYVQDFEGGELYVCVESSYVLVTGSSAGGVGSVGPAGPIGLTGPTGPQGNPGVQGPIGPTGLTGATGSAGAQGITGPTGLTGSTGPTGSNGPAGTAASVTVGTVAGSAPGTIPTVANSGSSSAAVLNFTIPAGATGASGPTGATGVAGVAGVAGATGPAGPTGPTGATGATGPSGSGSGTTPTGTGFNHVTGGAQDGAAHLLSSTDVTTALGTDTVNNTAYGFHTGSGGDTTCPTPTAAQSFLCMVAGVIQQSQNSGAYAPFGSSTGSMVYPGAGVGVSTGSAWGTSLAAPGSAFVGLTDVQTLLNKTFVAPILGAAQATSINNLIITAPSSTATLALFNGSSLHTAGAFSLTLSTSGTTNVTFPTSGTLAVVASPTFTGTPSAPTAAAGTNTTQLATTAYVTAAVAAIPGVGPSMVIPRDANAHYEVAAPVGSTFNTVGFFNGSGVGTYTAVNTPDAAGYVSMQTTTTATINSQVGVGSWKDILPLNNPSFQTIFHLGVTTNVQAWIGLCSACNTNNAGFTDLGSQAIALVGFRFIAGTDSTWACYASDSSGTAGTSSASGVTPSTTQMQKFDVVYVAGSPKYYINNTQVCSAFTPTHLPSTTTAMGANVVWENMTATAVTGNIFNLYYGAN